MTNVDNPHGFRATRVQGAGHYTGGGNVYAVAAGDSQVIAPGDPVVKTGTASAGGIPIVTQATAGTTNAVTGVMVSLTNGDGTVLQSDDRNTAASTLQYILVEDNPNIVFEAQVDGAFAITNIGSNGNLIIGTSTYDGKSICEVNSTGFATTAAHQVKVLRLYRVTDNIVGINARVEVLFNNHTEANGTAGI